MPAETGPGVEAGTPYLHASAIVCGETGILIRGASGSGKSTLALRLLEQAVAGGSFARLVGDDRVSLDRHGGRLVAKGHPAIAGLIEVRRQGLVRRAFEPRCVVRIVIDLSDELPRLPETKAAMIEIFGVSIYHLQIERRSDGASRVLAAIYERMQESEF